MDDEGLAVVCACLGGLQDDGSGNEIYVKHADCLESLKDLQRYMRRDHPVTRDMFMQLGKWNIVRQDIVPIIMRYSDNSDLVLNCVKLLVFLTMPTDSSSNQVHLQTEYLRQFTVAILDDDVIAVVIAHLEEPLQHLESGSPKDDDWKMLQLFLTLVRNLISIPDYSSQAAGSELYLKDRLLQLLFCESGMDLLVALTQHLAGQGGLRHDNHLILEIIHHVLLGQRPDLVAAAAAENFKVQKQSKKSSTTLRTLMDREREQLKILRNGDATLHSPFSGTFVRVALDGTKTIKTRTPHQSHMDNFMKKPQIKRGPIKRIVQETRPLMPTNDNLMVLLRDFVNLFLESGYNILMQTIKSDIRRGRAGFGTADVVTFFGVSQFFTAFKCCIAQQEQEKQKKASGTFPVEGVNELPPQKDLCGCIASTMDEDMFNLVISKWHLYASSAKLNKDWGPLAATGAVMKDMIHMLDLVLKRSGSLTKEGESEVRTARVLLYKIFYDQTDSGIIHFLQTLIKGFDIYQQPRGHLADLVEITHTVLRILENFTKDGAFRVLEKVRSGRMKRCSVTMQSEECEGEGAGECGTLNPEVDVGPGTGYLDGVSLSAELSAVDQGVECADEKQSITGGGVVDAEKMSISPNNQNVEDELGLEDISIKGTLGSLEAKEGEDNGPKSDSGDEDDGDSDKQKRTKEVNLDLHRCVKRFADNTVVRNYCWLLKFYNSNNAATNYYIVRMLQRICEDCVLEPILYQLSILKTIYALLSDRQIQEAGDHRFVVAFLTKVVRKFFKKLKTQPMLLVDLLFWKTHGECREITADYMIQSLQKAIGGSSTGQQRSSIADALGSDDDGIPTTMGAKVNEGSVAESENSELPWDSDRQDSLTKNSSSSPFSESHVAQVEELFRKYKNDQGYAQLIAQNLDASGRISAMQVVRKLEELGLVQPSLSRRKTLSSSGRGADKNQEPRGGKSGKSRIRRSINTNHHGAIKRKKHSFFSEAQDEELRVLFKRYGNDKQSSKIIAENLDGQITVAQVSRRLRALGLVKPKPLKGKIDSVFASMADSEDDEPVLNDLNQGKADQRKTSLPVRKAAVPVSDIEDVEPNSRLGGPESIKEASVADRHGDDLIVEQPRSDMAATLLKGVRTKVSREKSKTSVADASESPDNLPFALASSRTVRQNSHRPHPGKEESEVPKTSNPPEDTGVTISIYDKSLEVGSVTGETGAMPKSRDDDDNSHCEQHQRASHEAHGSFDLKQLLTSAGRPSSDLQASWGPGSRKRLQNGMRARKDGTDSGFESSEDDLRATWGPFAKQQRNEVPNFMNEVNAGATLAHEHNPHDSVSSSTISQTKLFQDRSDELSEPELVTAASGPSSSTPYEESVRDGESSPVKLLKRRRLTKKFHSPVIEEEDEQELDQGFRYKRTLGANSRRIARKLIDDSDVTIEDDGLNDF